MRHVIVRLMNKYGTLEEMRLNDFFKGIRFGVNYFIKIARFRTQNKTRE